MKIPIGIFLVGDILDRESECHHLFLFTTQFEDKTGLITRINCDLKRD